MNRKIHRQADSLGKRSVHFMRISITICGASAPDENIKGSWKGVLEKDRCKHCLSRIVELRKAHNKT